MGSLLNFTPQDVMSEFPCWESAKLKMAQKSAEKQILCIFKVLIIFHIFKVIMNSRKILVHILSMKKRLPSSPAHNCHVTIKGAKTCLAVNIQGRRQFRQ